MLNGFLLKRTYLFSYKTRPSFLKQSQRSTCRSILDLDLLDCFGREKAILLLKNTRFMYTFGVINSHLIGKKL